jgi:hypothetical protein
LDAFWKGDFSALLPMGIQLRDPLTTGRPNIPGNRLDQYLGGSLINKSVQTLQPYFGSPNQPGVGNNSVHLVNRDTIADQYTARADQMITQNETIGLRYTKSNTGGFIPNILGSPGVGRTEPLDSINGSGSWTAVLTPRTVSEFRAGANKYSDVTSYSAGSLPTALSLGLQGLHLGRCDHPTDAADLFLRAGRSHQLEIRRHRHVRRSSAFHDPEYLYAFGDSDSHEGQAQLYFEAGCP